eukprot:TRINITY_DN21618_c0_g1_i1.p1 TRINITY_DN21618_c0_g1~~TRINITY_DN21618_c0_g1_i1.p1  ORF type:complete len:690 (-),score=110.74 TRINITY_DN21618_c0_g1_i1:130-2166(-)
MRASATVLLLVLLSAPWALSEEPASVGETDSDVRNGSFVMLHLSANITGSATLRNHNQSATVTVEVEGLSPSTSYPTHVHSKTCEVYSGGPHYMHAEGEDEVEIHIPVTSDAKGNANASVEVPYLPGPEAASVVIHDPVNLTRLACADLKAPATEEEKSSETESAGQCSAEEEKLEAEEEAKERQGRLTIALCTAMLGLTYYVGYWLERFHIHFIPEAGVGIGIGILGSLFLMMSHSPENVHAMLKFDSEIFFIFMLPPIIFEAGYNMKRQAFFRNIGAICMYAFVGTTVSTFVVGGLVYAVGQLGLCHPLGGLASLVFGALISATDPVTVLAVFQALHADVDLYSLVFGESVLNDAVAIVLYRTLIIFKCNPVTAKTLGLAFGSFVWIFVGSILIGTACGLVSALLFKHLNFYKHDDLVCMELTLLCCFAYISFMLADGCHLSGIVSIMFCGIVMAHYTYNNLSDAAQTMSRKMFKVFAALAETFVFVYLGLAMFTYPQTFAKIRLIVLAFVIILIARIFNIVPNTLIVNLFRRDPHKKPAKINTRFQFMLWFSGLRGAVAFVIAVTSYAHDDFPENGDGAAILTTTLFIAVITVFTMGGSITWFMDKLKVRELEELHDDAKPDYTPDELSAMQANFLSYDRRFLKRFFTRYVHEHKEEFRMAALNGPAPQLDNGED